jgi:hypothetical protein
MNIPGFTAEASVEKISGNYQMAGTPNDLAGSRGAVPQMSEECKTSYRRCMHHAYLGHPEAAIWCTIHETFC